MSFRIWPKFGIGAAFSYPGWMYVLGLLIDSNANAASEPLFACLAYWASLSRSGPIVLVLPAGVKMWQPSQPCDLNSFAPVFASPAGTEGPEPVGIVPITVFAVGDTVFPPPQPASSSAIPRNGARRRMNARV